MAKLDAVKTIKKYEGQGFVNPRYDLTMENIQDIKNAYPHPYEGFCAVFLFGYIQGHKAATAEMRAAKNKISIERN